MPAIIKKKVVYGSGSNIELDKTLTIEGKAADAKAVGDAITVRCNSEGYLEVKVDGIWEQSELKAIEQNEVFLYNKGQELIEWDKTLEGITWGGVGVTGLQSATFNADNIYFETTTQGVNVCTINKEPVDLTDYSVVRFSAKVTKQTDNFGVTLLIVKNKSVIAQEGNQVSYKKMYTITDDYIEYELDISSLSGSYYLFLTSTETTGRAGYVNAISLVK